MKCNIYIFKTKQKPKDGGIPDTINEEKKALTTAFYKWVDKLKNISFVENEETYIKTYANGLKSIGEFFSFPDVKLSSIGYIVRDGKYVPRIYPTEHVERNIPAILDSFCIKCEALLDNNLGAEYFYEHETDENGIVWVDEDLVTKILDVCDKSLKSVVEGKKLLPTENDKYGKSYKSMVRAFARQMRHLRKLLKKKYLLYAIIVPRKIQQDS